MPIPYVSASAAEALFRHKIIRLDPSATWQITRNGVRVATVKGGVPTGSASPADVEWPDGVPRVTTGLAGEATFVVASRSGN